MDEQPGDDSNGDELRIMRPAGLDDQLRAIERSIVRHDERIKVQAGRLADGDQRVAHLEGELTSLHVDVTEIKRTVGTMVSNQEQEARDRRDLQKTLRSAAWTVVFTIVAFAIVVPYIQQWLHLGG